MSRQSPSGPLRAALTRSHRGTHIVRVHLMTAADRIKADVPSVTLSPARHRDSRFSTRSPCPVWCSGRSSQRGTTQRGPRVPPDVWGPSASSSIVPFVTPPDGNGQSNPSRPPARWSVRGSRGKGLVFNMKKKERAALQLGVRPRVQREERKARSPRKLPMGRGKPRSVFPT